MITTLMRRLGQQAQNITRGACSGTVAATNQEKQYNELQERALKEQCILVNENDEVTGYTSKEDCHRVDPVTKKIKLHRAFSVFLFNSKGELLLQKRAQEKITFPNMYTNSCCSHPLHDIEVEREELNDMGVRKAAQRRLNYELGIPVSQVRPENFYHLTKMLYSHVGDGKWGENEITHILFLQKDVDLKPNMNEVSEVRYIKRDNLEDEISKFDAPITPWFRLILNNHLKLWWDNLHQLKKFEDHKSIYRY